MNRRVFTALAGALLMLASSSAGAQSACTATPRECARTHMEEGDAKRTAGDLKGALASFKQADALVQVPTIGLEVARVQEKLGQLVEARETLGRVVRIPARTGEPPVFATARSDAEQLSNDLAARIPSVQIVLDNADPNLATQVSIDDENVPPAALNAPRKINPGTHVIVAKVGAAELKQTVDVPERDTKTVTFDFKDQVLLPTGSSGKSKALVYGGFGVALVGIGIGSITGLMSLSKTSELDGHCPTKKCDPKYQGDVDSATSLGNISTVAFIVGGVGAATGIVGLLASNGSSPKKDSPAPTTARRPSVFAPEQVRAVLAPSYVGLTGSF